MSLLSGPLKIAFGFGLGVVAAEMAKEARPAFQGLGRPLLKAAMKSGVILAREGQVRLAKLRETLQDVSAEVEQEMRQAPPVYAAEAKQESKIM